MMFERTAALLPFIALLLIPAWSMVRLAAGFRSHTWRTPSWYARATWTALFLAVLVWLRGAFAGGLDAENACTAWHGQHWDQAYRDTHRDQWDRPIPLSNPCNADYNLVPGWINPTLAVLILAGLVGLAGLVWTATQRTPYGSRRSSRRPGRI